MAPGQMGAQSYGGYYNQSGYNANNNQNTYNNDNQYSSGRPMALYNQTQGGGQPGQTGHHKKPYGKGGNQHYSGAPAQHYKPKSN